MTPPERSMTSQPNEILIQVTAPYFVAGCVARHGKVAEAAPILRRLIGLNGHEFYGVCWRFGWRMEVVRSAYEGDRHA